MSSRLASRPVAKLWLSRAAMTELAEAGLTLGWFVAWLRAAGAARVETGWLEETLACPDALAVSGWGVAVAETSALMRVALAHGRRVMARGERGGAVRPHGATPLELENPPREGWVYDTRDGGRCLLLPLGDIAYQRERWLRALNDGAPQAPLWVCLNDGEDGSAADAMPEGGLALEAGLVGRLEPPPEGVAWLNDGGYLPEEWLASKLAARALKARFAESCTGGGMAERMSRLPGASAVLDCAWTTYSNEAKRRLLKVPARLIARHGAVSREVAEAMARGGMDRECACVAATGIAGPGGGSDDKPVGTVWIAAALPDGRIESRLLRLAGSRAAIRRQTVNHAFALLGSML